MKIKTLVTVSSALIAGCVLTSVFAATDTANFNVTASVAKACKIQNTTDINFGAYDPTSVTPLTANGSIQIRCNKEASTTYPVSLDNGLYASGAQRRMNSSSASDFLNYQIYIDNTYVTIWDTTNTVPVSASGTPQVLVTYGQVPIGQNPGVATDYTDTVQATVTF